MVQQCSRKYLERFKGVKLEGVVQDLRGHVSPGSHPGAKEYFDILTLCKLSDFTYMSHVGITCVTKACICKVALFLP